MLNELKTINLVGVELEKAIALLSFGRALQAEYAELEVPVPEWLQVRMRELKREVKTRVTDMKEHRLRELKARRATLETPESQRRKIDLEIKSLESELTTV